jgi:hypothetical protein
VAHLAEADARRLFAREAFPSMFAHCTEALRLSEAEAYLRIAVARASREHPVLLEMLADGRLHLSAIAKLAPHHTPENRDVLLARAVHRSKRQVEEPIRDLAPRPDVASSVRRLPEPVSRGAAQTPPELTAERVVQPLGGERYRVQFTASARLRDKLERLQSLLRTDVPQGDLAAIVERAVTNEIERIERRRNALTNRPRKRLEKTDVSRRSRHVPAAVRRAVNERDGNRCGYVSASGRRCADDTNLEYHHRRPFGMGGNHDPTNIGLLCRTHNCWLGELDYGRRTGEQRDSRKRTAAQQQGP